MRPYQDVLSFWFVDHGKDDWFGGKAEFDAELAAAFSETHAEVSRGEAWEWRKTSQGKLAEIIVLDQFSRQLHRGSPEAFAQDKMALALAQEAVAAGQEKTIPMEQRMFLFMPYMHAESLVIQEEGIKHFQQFGPEMLKFMTGHRDCIRRFGRFPSVTQRWGGRVHPKSWPIWKHRATACFDRNSLGGHSLAEQGERSWKPRLDQASG